jgi:ABC-type transport system substrate-binding protein
MQDVVGMPAYAAGRAAHIVGVIAHGDELTIVLRRPAGDLPARLSAHYFCPVPIGTPINPRPGTTIPYAGPYYVASYTPGQQLLLRRNPDYTGPRPRRAKEIVVTLGVSASPGRWATSSPAAPTTPSTVSRSTGTRIFALVTGRAARRPTPAASGTS